MKVSALISASTTQSDLGPAQADPGTATSADELTRLMPRARSESIMTEDSSAASPRLEKKTMLALTDKQAIRREQCRANQARYRNKQLNLKRQLQRDNQRLEEEIQGLKLRKRSIRFERKTNQSPWTIVGEVFRLLEDGFRSPWRLASMEEMMKHADTRQRLAFLEKAFAHNVSMGDLRGINALMDQWRRYSLYFEEPHLELKRVEVIAKGVVSATATFSVTITDFTLRCVLPELATCGGRKTLQLKKNLLGKRMDCNCSMRFRFDEASGRVVRLEPKIDLVTPMLRILGNIKDVTAELKYALISSECVLGDLPERARRGSN
ncbi:hypothetical protein PF010_g15650 [Phytophthora fragariae]|uniref:Bzip transcription factor n=1 Tax=Phytophthora fragariae TaxID=53985 RepID=A0A6A3IKC1_9STRA|nr:hypothetical protein PF011_g22564 [Phytophthora fragariae]KAE9098213.1 hypothetical protein PF010_g15650 [Phytophthora fragariae]KAE9213688.1 hypothetical protein PF004_g15262 [Phytophthora fragariae]